jgi:hypothetical protein
MCDLVQSALSVLIREFKQLLPHEGECFLLAKKLKHWAQQEKTSPPNPNDFLSFRRLHLALQLITFHAETAHARVLVEALQPTKELMLTQHSYIL